MSTAAPILYETRCEKCYHVSHLSVDEAGSALQCKSCGHLGTAPPPTTSAIQRAAGVEMPEEPQTPVAVPVEEGYTREQINRIAKRRADEALAKKRPKRGPDGMVASRLQRFAAQFIDGFVMTIAAGIGAVSVAVLAGAGIVDIPNLGQRIPPELLAEFLMVNFPFHAIAVFSFFPLSLLLIQWSMISSHGQTIGKKMLCIAIVNDSGIAPGFVQGVVTRNWIKNVLAVIPFFSLIDLLFIFGESRRCIHDYMASTYVVKVM